MKGRVLSEGKGKKERKKKKMELIKFLVSPQHVAGR